MRHISRQGLDLICRFEGFSPAQQKRAIFIGVALALVLRILFALLTVQLLKVPGLMLVGGLGLIWIAYKLLAPQHHGEVEGGGGDDHVRAGNNLREAIKIIILADVSMSIDNVLAVTGAAEGHLGMAALGIGLSIPMVIWGSAMLSRVMQHHPWIVWLGGGILGHVAGSLLLEDPKIVEWIGHTQSPGWHPLSLGLAVAFTAFGAWGHSRTKHGKG